MWDIRRITLSYVSELIQDTFFDRIAPSKLFSLLTYLNQSNFIRWEMLKRNLRLPRPVAFDNKLEKLCNEF